MRHRCRKRTIGAKSQGCYGTESQERIICKKQAKHSNVIYSLPSVILIVVFLCFILFLVGRIITLKYKIVNDTIKPHNELYQETNLSTLIWTQIAIVLTFETLRINMCKITPSRMWLGNRTSEIVRILKIETNEFTKMSEWYHSLTTC